MTGWKRANGCGVGRTRRRGGGQQCHTILRCRGGDKPHHAQARARTSTAERIFHGRVRELVSILIHESNNASRLIHMDKALNEILGDIQVLLLNVTDAVRLGRKANAALLAQEWLLTATAMGPQMVLERTKKLEVHTTIFTDCVRRMKIGGIQFFRRISRNKLIVANRFFNIFFADFCMLFPAKEKK